MTVSGSKKHWKYLPAKRKFRLLRLVIIRLKKHAENKHVKGPHYFAMNMLLAQERLMNQEYERFQAEGDSLPSNFEKETERWLESTLKLKAQILTDLENRTKINQAIHEEKPMVS